MDFGGSLTDYENRVDKCTALLAKYLNKGHLGLFLGAGVSFALLLPSWENLVNKCLAQVLPSEPIITGRSTPELKKITSRIKAKFSDERTYLELVKKQLYDGVDFDFRLAKKEMLIALTSLMVGKNRGNVTDVLTFNFDSIIEWYLRTNGLNVNVITKDHLLTRPADVEILHLHGYLPHDKADGFLSDDIVFTHEDFLIRERGESYWKVLMNEYFKKRIFLAVGLNPQSICDDIVPYLITLSNDWYFMENIPRRHIYGVAFVTNCDPDQSELMIKNGVIPCTIGNRDEIPSAIFTIAQKASELR